jgi:hypothetical protein
VAVSDRLLAPVAVGLWSIGLLLYLLLVALILQRWLTVPVTPQTLSPPYWILMGATAIIVLAGARILGLPAAPAVVKATAGFVEGFSFALWAFGTWWIPLLVVLGIWRHVRHRWPLTYEPGVVERGLPARDVQRRDGSVRQGCPPRVHGTAEPLHAPGGGGRVGSGGRRVRRPDPGPGGTPSAGGGITNTRPLRRSGDGEHRVGRLVQQPDRD